MLYKQRSIFCNVYVHVDPHINTVTAINVQYVGIREVEILLVGMAITGTISYSYLSSGSHIQWYLLVLIATAEIQKFTFLQSQKLYRAVTMMTSDMQQNNCIKICCCDS